MEFVVNVTASLIGSALLLVFLSIFSKTARWLLTALLGRILDIDVEYVFKNKIDAMSDLKSEIESATEVAFLASRGNELQREAFSSIFHARPEKREITVRILLPKCGLENSEYDWTAQRERELAVFDTSFGERLLHKQIEANVSFVEPNVRAKRVEMRRFNAPHIGRIVLTDRCVYFTPYRHNSHGQDSRVYKYRSGGEMYKSYKRVFDQLWEADAANSCIAQKQNTSEPIHATEPAAR